MLFVTGMPRSGTTLIEKLISQHAAISLLSQPFPFLFLDAKRAFLSTIGRGADPFPLGDLFNETYYAVADLTRHLLERRIESSTVRAVFAAMDGYSGQYTKAEPHRLDAVLASMPEDDLAGTMARLYAALSDKPAARHVGGKETGCEEFLPYLLARGAHAVLILRDPRDVLASLNHGRGPEFAGSVKPTLFNVRQWRKSVAFLIHLQGQPGFTGVRYEDVVVDPVGTVNPIVTALGAAPFSPTAFDHGVTAEDGSPWQGNSSHAPQRALDASSVGRHRDVLPPAVRRQVEALCYPELCYLGYDVSLAWRDVGPSIAEFTEPYPGVRPELRDRYTDPRRVDEELERVRLLEAAGPAPRPYFLFDGVAEALRKAVRK